MFCCVTREGGPHHSAREYANENGSRINAEGGVILFPEGVCAMRVILGPAACATDLAYNDEHNFMPGNHSPFFHDLRDSGNFKTINSVQLALRFCPTSIEGIWRRDDLVRVYDEYADDFKKLSLGLFFCEKQRREPERERFESVSAGTAAWFRVISADVPVHSGTDPSASGKIIRRLCKDSAIEVFEMRAGIGGTPEGTPEKAKWVRVHDGWTSVRCPLLDEVVLEPIPRESWPHEETGVEPGVTAVESLIEAQRRRASSHFNGFYEGEDGVVFVIRKDEMVGAKMPPCKAKICDDCIEAEFDGKQMKGTQREDGGITWTDGAETVVEWDRRPYNSDNAPLSHQLSQDFDTLDLVDKWLVVVDLNKHTDYIPQHAVVPKAAGQSPKARRRSVCFRDTPEVVEPNRGKGRSVLKAQDPCVVM